MLDQFGSLAMPPGFPRGRKTEGAFRTNSTSARKVTMALTSVALVNRASADHLQNHGGIESGFQQRV